MPRPGFPRSRTPGRAAEGILGAGIPLSSCEILDRVSIDVVNKAMGLNVPDNVGCILFIEIDGNKQAVRENIEKIDTHLEGVQRPWQRVG